MSALTQEIFILGLRQNGELFRPSDWAERLSGVMSPFGPSAPVPGQRLAYSPWCRPSLNAGVRCVVVSPLLRAAHPMAWDFVMGFARDNGLQVVQACSLPEPSAKPQNTARLGTETTHGDASVEPKGITPLANQRPEEVTKEVLKETL